MIFPIQVHRREKTNRINKLKKHLMKKYTKSY